MTTHSQQKCVMAFKVVWFTCIWSLMVQVILNMFFLHWASINLKVQNCTNLPLGTNPEIIELSRQVTKIQQQLQVQQQTVHKLTPVQEQTTENIVELKDDIFFPFTIRDSRRLVPTQIPFGFHVFDYVDVHSRDQVQTNASVLFMDGKAVSDQPTPCQRYHLRCYREKIILLGGEIEGFNTSGISGKENEV